jgi:TusA-related sulfurtransferase
MNIYDDIRNHYTILSADLFLPDLFYQLIDIHPADLSDQETYKIVLELVKNYNHKKILIKEKKVNGKIFHAEWRFVYGQLIEGMGDSQSDFTRNINMLIRPTQPYFNFFAKAKFAPLPENQEIPIHCLRMCNYVNDRNILTPEYVSAFCEHEYPVPNALDVIVYFAGLVIPSREYHLSNVSYNQECWEEETPAGMGTDTGYLRFRTPYQMEYRNELSPTPTTNKTKTASKKIKKSEEKKISLAPQSKLYDFTEGEILEVISPRQYHDAVKTILSFPENERPEVLENLTLDNRVYTCRYTDGMGGTKVGQFIYKRFLPYEEVLPFYFLKDKRFLHQTVPTGQSLSYISIQPDNNDNIPQFATLRTLHKLEYNSTNPREYYALFLIDEEGVFIMQPPYETAHAPYDVSAMSITQNFKNILLRKFTTNVEGV